MKSLKKIALFFVLSICAIAITQSCKKDDPILGFNPEEGFDDTRRGSVETTVMTDIQQATLSDTVYKTGSSIFLSLGAYKDVESRILLKFADLPTGISIREASLLLSTNAILANTTSKTSFPVSVHEVTTNWNEVTVTDETFQDAFDLVSLGTAEILSLDRDPTNSDSLNIEAVRIPLSQDALPLIADSLSRLNQYGVLIDFSDATFIKEFFSSENPVRAPQLQLIVDTDSTSGQDFRVEVTEDAFLPRQRSVLPDGPLYADNALGNVVVMKFDFSSIPQFSTVNRVTMELSVDLELSLLKNDGLDLIGNGITLQLSPLTAPFDPASDLQFDSSTTLPVIVSSGLELVRVANPQFSSTWRGLVQRWINQNTENHGFVLHSFTPGLDVDRVAFTVTDSVAATLDMEYSVAPFVNDQDN